MQSTRERELLLLCARTTPGAAERDRVRTLVHEGIDWTLLLSLGERHWVTPLLAWNLGGAPGEVAAALDARLRENVVWSLRLAARLVDVMQALEARGVPAVTWKGPTLAATAYGHAGLRTFADLDVLVRAADLPRAHAALTAQGWHAVPPAPDASEWMFVRPADRAVVELHWRPTPWSFAVDLDPMDMRHEQARIGQRVVTQLAPADLLVTLCAHGTKHQFQRLQWIADIAELVRARADLDWSRAVRLAEGSGSLRMLHLGLRLAEHLLGARMPAAMTQRVAGDGAAVALADAVARRLFTDAPVISARAEQARTVWFQLRAKERVRDRVRYATLAPALRAWRVGTMCARRARGAREVTFGNPMVR